MNLKTLTKINTIFKYVLLVSAVLFIILYLILAFFRIQYPFELDVTESGALQQVRRLTSGQNLYAKPSVEYVSLIYTPLYFYLSSLVAIVLGVGLMPLRLVSLLASVGSFFIIYRIVKQETTNWFYGILSAALVAATYRIGGAWFDVAKEDSLLLFLLLVAIYLIRFNSTRIGYLTAGLFLALAFLTKQTAIIIAIPLIGYTITRNWRRSIWLVVPVVILIGISTLVFSLLSDGWYLYYVFDVPKEHALLKDMLVYFWLKDLIAPLPIAFALSIFYISYQFIGSQKKPDLFYILTTVGMIGGSWLSRLHSGGYDNVLLPAFAILAILFGLALDALLKFIQAIAQDKAKLVGSYVYLACFIQFACLVYNPMAQLPTSQDLAAGQQLNAKLAQIKGSIFIPYHSYFPILAKKDSYADGMAIGDILRGNNGEIKTYLINDISAAIKNKKFGAIILDTNGSIAPFDTAMFQKDIEQNYILEESILLSDNVFVPVTGLKTIPKFIYVPKK